MGSVREVIGGKGVGRSKGLSMGTRGIGEWDVCFRRGVNNELVLVEKLLLVVGSYIRVLELKIRLRGI
jgi:hypothetical protein